MKNFNQAADNNKEFILRVLELLFIEPGMLLEIGSGYGQHAIHISRQLQSVTWQPTEVLQNLPALVENLAAGADANVLAPTVLEIGGLWPGGKYQYAYAANVLHIVSERLLPELFMGLHSRIWSGGLLCFYGPFKYDGEFTTDSNARFDDWLKRNYVEGGIRDIEIVERQAATTDFKLIDDFSMPANNQLLVFRRQ